MPQIAFQAVVNTPGEAKFYETYLTDQKFDVEVMGPFARGIFDLKDVSTGTIVKAPNCYVVMGTKEVE